MKRTITVKGIGKISTKPDYVILSMSLKSQHKEYDKAIELSATQLSQLNKNLTSIGFETTAIKTTNFTVTTDYKRTNDNNGNYSSTFNGFICRHQLKVEFDFDMQRLSQTLSTVASCIANPELHITFTVKNPTEIKQTLLKQATINARQKAEILCEASGVKLGQLLTIDYNWAEINLYSRTNYTLEENCLRSAATPSIEIEPDNIDTSDTATLIWEIE